MFTNKRLYNSTERRDRIGREVLRSAALGEDEAEEASSSPFLYARVRARIAAERERRAAGENWFSLLAVARRAVPAMTFSAVIAFSAFWLGGANTSLPAESDALIVASDAGIESVLLPDDEILSNDEMLDTILSNDEAEAFR